MTFPPLVVSFFSVGALYRPAAGLRLLDPAALSRHGTPLRCCRNADVGDRRHPVFIAGLLLAVGAIDVSFIGLADLRPSPFAVMIAPLARLPKSWIWGAIGGWLGRRLPHSKSAAPAS